MISPALSTLRLTSGDRHRLGLLRVIAVGMVESPPPSLRLRVAGEQTGVGLGVPAGGRVRDPCVTGAFVFDALSRQRTGIGALQPLDQTLAHVALQIHSARRSAH